MKGSRSLVAAAIAAASWSSAAYAQEAAQYTDEDTGITFTTWTSETTSSFTFGLALPEDALENDATEYIGMLRCASSADDKKGWCGFSHGQSGQMTQALLVVAWPHGDDVLMTLRYADGYTAPVMYEGDAVLTKISSKVDDTGYEVIYRCENCFAWDHNGVAGSVSTSQGYIVGGRAQSNVLPDNPACPGEITYGFHSDGFGQWGAQLEDAVNPAYSEWVALATTAVETECVAEGGGDEEGEQQANHDLTGNDITSYDHEDWWWDYWGDDDEDEDDEWNWWEDDEDEEDDDWNWWDEEEEEEEEPWNPWRRPTRRPVQPDPVETSRPSRPTPSVVVPRPSRPTPSVVVTRPSRPTPTIVIPRPSRTVQFPDEPSSPSQPSPSAPAPEPSADEESSTRPRPPRPTPTFTPTRAVPVPEPEPSSEEEESSTRPTRPTRPVITVIAPLPSESSDEQEPAPQPTDVDAPEPDRSTRPPRPTPTFTPTRSVPAPEPEPSSEEESPARPTRPVITVVAPLPSEDSEESSASPTRPAITVIAPLPSEEPSESSEEPSSPPTRPTIIVVAPEPEPEPSSEESPIDATPSSPDAPTRPPRPTPTFTPVRPPSLDFEVGDPETTSQDPPTPSPADPEVAPTIDFEVGMPEESTTSVLTATPPVDTETPPEDGEGEGEEEPEDGEEVPEDGEEVPEDGEEVPEEGEEEEEEDPEPVPAPECTAIDEDETFDYVVIGAGAGGIPVAERLVQAGHKVLLLEKGPPSTARWGGTMKPEWLEGESLTRFDVPGLCNQIWHDSTGIVCTDMDQIAGCVLGGGTAVNAGLWWKPHPLDWDDNFPTGWKADDVAAATNRVFTRIPGTTHPSMDGYLYQREGYDVLANGLEAAGWSRLNSPNAHPDQKNHTFGHTTFMFANGERGGPLATYLVTASRNPNFSLWTDTSVNRLVREGGRVTGVEVECTADGGRSGVINVGSAGRVILSAGTFGSAKLLMFSGIGPASQLELVSSVRGESFIAQEQWIELPVGENLIDHLNTDVIVEHDDVVQYNYTEAWWDPIQADVDMYLEDRSGILAAAAPNIGPMIWDDIEVSDGTTRQLQWTCRMEGSLNLMGNHTITMSQYLGRGVVSRGRMALTPSLTTRVATLPYLRGDEGDREAIIQGLENVRNALKDVPGLRMLSPADNVTSEEYVDDYLVTVGRRSNHWMGTNKMGEDDGRDGGTAVVDTNTKVYGVDNLFVVDASVFPGMVTGNPSAAIVIVAEHAADRILALPISEEAPEEETPEEEAPEEEEPEEEAPEEEVPEDDNEVPEDGEEVPEDGEEVPED